MNANASEWITQPRFMILCVNWHIKLYVRVPQKLLLTCWTGLVLRRDCRRLTKMDCKLLLRTSSWTAGIPIKAVTYTQVSHNNGMSYWSLETVNGRSVFPCRDLDLRGPACLPILPSRVTIPTYGNLGHHIYSSHDVHLKSSRRIRTRSTGWL